MNKGFIFGVCATCVIVLLSGCSLSKNDANQGERINNVAYSVPESVARSATDVRKKPTKPSWTDDVQVQRKPERKISAIPSEMGAVYTVQRGDTIYGIARRLKCPARRIMELNNLDQSSKLRIGQTLRIPENAWEKLPEPGKNVRKDAAKGSISGEVTVYTVQRGDTIYGIARRLKCPAQRIMELNDMDKSSKLYVGQTLKVPGNGGVLREPSRITPKDTARGNVVKYTVEQGDSLSRIAKMHSMKVAELRELNGLSSDTIRPGQQLNVYKSKNPVAKETKKYVLDSGGLYTIQSGDSLDKIASNFGVSSKALKEANGIDDPLKLQIGKKLVIPSKSPSPSPAAPAQSQSRSAATPSEAGARARNGSHGNSPGRSHADSDDFFETFDNIKVFEVEN
jgi:D-gamma-glutamyl-meso-diaminopimelic acid endopeptidase CwlS